MLVVWTAGLFFLPAALALSARTIRVEKTLPTTSHPLITIHNIRGSVKVRGWDRQAVHAVCELNSRRIEFFALCIPPEARSNLVQIETREVKASPASSDERADYVIEVPRDASVEILDPMGSVTLEGLRGDATVNSIGASVFVSDVSGHLHVQTIEGNIQIVRAAGRVEAYSVDGNLHFIHPTTARLLGNTTTGKIIYEGGFASGGYYVLKDYSGEVDIFCPLTASFELSARSVRGKVENEMPMKPRRILASPFPQSTSFVGEDSTGAALVKATSFSGTIRVRPLQ